MIIDDAILALLQVWRTTAAESQHGACAVGRDDTVCKKTKHFEGKIMKLTRINTDLSVRGTFNVELEILTEPGEDYEIMGVEIDGKNADWILDADYEGLHEMIDDALAQLRRDDQDDGEDWQQ